MSTSDPEAYQDSFAKGLKIMRKLGVNPEIELEPQMNEKATGIFTVTITVRYPDRARRDEWSALLEQAQRYQSWLESHVKLRTLVSDQERERESRPAPAPQP